MKKVLLDTKKLVIRNIPISKHANELAETYHSVYREIARKCYKIVNQVKNLRTPQFIGYKNFRTWFV